MAMWESMGPIADRGRDHLGSSDLAVLQFRRQMTAAARAVKAGEPAIGARSGVRHLDLASFEGVVPKSADWRAFSLRNAARTAAAE
jgi:phthalate 4,5-dioxygenase oxygenase subunit